MIHVSRVGTTSPVAFLLLAVSRRTCIAKLTAMLLAVTLNGLAPCEYVAGQNVMLLRTPSDCFDFGRDTLGLTPATIADTNTGAQNAAILNLAFSRHGQKDDSSTRVRKPFYIPPAMYPIDQVTLGVDDAGTSARAGMQIHTGGGMGIGVNRNGVFSDVGNITRLYYTGLRNATQAAVTYKGAGLYLGPMELTGFDLITGTNYNLRDTPDKCPTGFRITSLATDGVPNGRIQSAGLFLQGFKKGIEILQADSSGNNDNLTWNYLDFDACDVGYECNSSQSVTHIIHKAHTSYFVDTVFKFVKGGDLHCYSLQVNNPACTVLDLSGMTYDSTYGNFEIRNVRLDPGADDPVLLKLAAYAGTPRNVIITGSIPSGCTYTTADLVQGEDEDDRIFIRFTGSTQAVSDFNGESTVDEAPF